MLSDDLLPQPYRMVNKVLQEIVASALDEIGKRLQQGCVVDKQFVPPRTLPTVPLHMQRLTVPMDAARSPNLVPSRGHGVTTTCSRLGLCECIQGLSNGAVRIVTSDGAEPEFVSPPLLTDGPIVSVALSRPLYNEPVYAAASGRSVALIAVDVRDSTPPPSPVPVSGYVGVTCRTVCHITANDISQAIAGTASLKSTGGVISSVQLSLDGRMLAVGLDGDSAVLVFAIPAPPAPAADHTAATPTTSAAAGGGGASTTEAATTTSGEAPRFVCAASPPPPPASSHDPQTSVVPSQPNPHAVFDFFCRGPQPGPTLGYRKERQNRSPLSAVSLFVAWCGTQWVSRFPLSELYPGSRSAVAEAQNLLQAAAAQAQAATAASASAATAGGGKAGKSGGKGNTVAADSPAAATAGSASSIAPYPEIFFNGRRDLQLSQKIVSCVFDSEKQLCAIGCLNGLVAVHNGASIHQIYSAAPHRLKQETVNELVPVSMQFQPRATSGIQQQQLVVAFSVQRLPHRCFVDVYNIAGDRLMKAGCQSSEPVCGGAAAPVCEAETTPATLPMGCASRMKYFNQLRAVIPVGGLPLAIVLVDQGSFVLDSTRGDVIARVHESCEEMTHHDSLNHNVVLDNVPIVMKSDDSTKSQPLSIDRHHHGVDAALKHGRDALGSFAVVASDSVLVSPQQQPNSSSAVADTPESESSSCCSVAPVLVDPFSIFRIDAAALVAELYPTLQPLLSTTYGQIPPQLLEALKMFFAEVPSSKRNDPAALDVLSQKLTSLYQAPQGHLVATHGGGTGSRSAQPSLGGTALSKQSAVDATSVGGRLSRASVQSKGGAVAAPSSTKGRSSATPAVPGPSATPASSAAAIVSPGGPTASSWAGAIRCHIEQREDTRHLRKDRLKGFWEAMKKR